MHDLRGTVAWVGSSDWWSLVSPGTLVRFTCLPSRAQRNGRGNSDDRAGRDVRLVEGLPSGKLT